MKGYEYAPDQYVVITDEDLEKVPLKTVRSIEIEQFAPKDETTRTHAQFTKQAYYIEPDKIGRKAFYLMRQVLLDKELTAICKVVIRDREALAALDPFEDTMVLTTLHWPDEIRSTKELDLPAEDFDFKAAELKMAEQLVEAMTDSFDPTKYKDEYREALLQVIEAKVDGPGDRGARAGRGVDQARRPDEAARGVGQAGDRREDQAVSVAEAKKERASRPAKAADAKPASKPPHASRPRRQRTPRTRPRRPARPAAARHPEAARPDRDAAAIGVIPRTRGADPQNARTWSGHRAVEPPS